MSNTNNKSFIPNEQKCGRCKQINAFICEHNTPVRNSLLIVSKPNDSKPNKPVLQYSKRDILPDELPPHNFLKLNPELAPTNKEQTNNNKNKPTVVKKEGCCAKCCCCCVIV